MNKSIDRPNSIKEIGTFQDDDAILGRTSVKCRPSQTVIQGLPDLESKFLDLQICSVNVGTLRGRSGDCHH